MKFPRKSNEGEPIWFRLLLLLLLQWNHSCFCMTSIISVPVITRIIHYLR